MNQTTPPSEPIFLAALWILMVAGAGMVIAAFIGCVSPSGGGWLLYSNPWTYRDVPIGVGWSEYIDEDAEYVHEAFAAFPCQIFEESDDPLIYIDKADIDGNYRLCGGPIDNMGQAAGVTRRCDNAAEIWISDDYVGAGALVSRLLYAHELGHAVGLPHSDGSYGCRASIMNRGVLSWAGERGDGCRPISFYPDEQGRLMERYCP